MILLGLGFNFDFVEIVWTKENIKYQENQLKNKEFFWMIEMKNLLFVDVDFQMKRYFIVEMNQQTNDPEIY